MATARSNDASRGDDLSVSASGASSSSKRIPSSKARNAFTALMSSSTSNPPKRKRTPPSSTPLTDPARNTTLLGRDGLGAYVSSPDSFPASRVIYHTPAYVLINDLYPKSSIHLLLLPRSLEKIFLHPFEAFEDASFLAETRLEVAKAKKLVAKELRRRFGQFSVQDQELLKEEEREEDEREMSEATDKEGELNARDEVRDKGGNGDDGGRGGDAGADNRLAKKNHSSYSNDENKKQPRSSKGRDWDEEILVGVHAVPSMRHLHIHILSRDRYSACVKHRKHYNSFATAFFVPLEDFPLDGGDKRRWPGREGFLEENLRCWRCGRDFGRKFEELKRHLLEEFEVWKME